MLPPAISRIFKIETDRQKRVFGLDVFRAVAILLVVLSHGSFLINKAAPGFPYIKLPDGVELFFVLSGFLIGGILIKMFAAAEQPDLKKLAVFWKRRWFRTLPNYYLVLLINLLFVSTGIINGELEQFGWKFFLFLQNFATPFTGFFWESWSLSIEEWFYVITPIAISVAFWLFRREYTPKYIFLGVIFFFLAAPLMYRIWISPNETDAFWFENTYRKLVVTRLDAIMYGVLFAWINFYYSKLWERFAEVAFIAGLILLYIVLIPEKNPDSFYQKTFYFSVNGIGTVLLLPFATKIKSAKGKVAKAFTHISLISYSMYLINLGIVAQVIEKHFMPVSAAGALLWYFVFWAMVVLLSTLLYKYFEKPIMDRRDH